MASLQIPNIRMEGMAAAVPSQRQDNETLALIPEKDRALFFSSTGILHRRVAPKDVCASDLCHQAAEKLLSACGTDRHTIGAVISVTQTPDHRIPGNAALLQHRLRLPSSCLSLDIQSGCAGYVYGLATAASLLHSGVERVLLLAGDTLTHAISDEDRSTWPVFSDAGSATLLCRDTSGHTLHAVLGSDGEKYHALCAEAGGFRVPFEARHLQRSEHSAGVVHSPLDMHMDGLDVFAFTLEQAPSCIRRLMEITSTGWQDYDYVVFHQASRIILKTLQGKLGIPAEKMPVSLEEWGNTSMASIPLTCVTQLQEEMRKPLHLLLCGYGAGLSWGALSIRTENIVCPEIVEV